MNKPEATEQHLRHCMLLFFDEGWTATKTTKKLTELYGAKLTPNRCQFWFRRFKSGDRSLVDEPRSGRPSKFDDDMLKAMVESDPRLSIEELSQKLVIPWSTVQEHMKKIGKVHRMGIWIPHALSEDNKNTRMDACNSFLTRHKIRPFLSQIVTSDEKWIVYDNVKRKKQWLSKTAVPVPTPKPGLTLRKVLLCVWWDIRGIIYYELLKPGDTVTAAVYCEQLERMNEKLKVKRPDLVNRKGVILLHDNARPHKAVVTREKIAHLNFEVLNHPPYSPDLAPSDFYLFRSLEHTLRGKKFNNVKEVENFLNSYFSSKTSNFFKRGIEKLPERWQTVLNNNGDYIL